MSESRRIEVVITTHMVEFGAAAIALGEAINRFALQMQKAVAVVQVLEQRSVCRDRLGFGKIGEMRLH